MGDVDDDLQRALADAAARGADAVITSGGVSAGAFEVVKTAIADMSFVQVAMQPGRPQGFAAGDPLVFGLPGNPVSAAVSFEVFVRPALLAMQGRAQLHRRMLRLPVVVGWRPPRGRRQYLPILFAEGGVAPATAGGSHLAGALARAEGYAVVPSEVDSVSPGDIVDVMLALVSELAAILLAGGRGSRMGGVHKPLLEIGGTTLLDAAIAAARDAGCDPIVAVGDSAIAVSAAASAIDLGPRGPAVRRPRRRDPGRTPARDGASTARARLRSAARRRRGGSARRSGLHGRRRVPCRLVGTPAMAHRRSI